MQDETYHEVASEVANLMGIPVDSLRPETTIREIGMDSLDGLQLLIELERAVKAQIEEADLKRFTTLQSIVDVVNQRLREAAAG
jgi:acyl carrier protein